MELQIKIKNKLNENVNGVPIWVLRQITDNCITQLKKEILKSEQQHNLNNLNLALEDLEEELLELIHNKVYMYVKNV